jgi:chromosome partitioning protein
VEEGRAHNPDLKCVLVINRRVVNSAIGRDVRKALKQLQVPILKTDLGQRVLFAETMASGGTVLDHQFSKAAMETRKFVNELRRIK